MIPSANSTGDLNWHASAATDNWADHPAAVAAVGGAYSSASSIATDSRYHNLNRHQILDWENAMLLAHHESVYDQQVDDYSKPPTMPASMHADPISSLSHPRHYENILSAHMHSSTNNSISSHNAWGLLSTVCSRSGSGGQLPQQETGSTFLQAASAPYNYESCLSHEGAEALVGYGNLAAAGGLYSDSLRSGSSAGANMLGLSSFDQRRLEDIVKRELYTTHDFNSRLGLNLGGRTYFSAADDFAFGRWGKRLRPNSPGCLMQPAPLCQAEGCKADLSMAKHYHRRHKVCEYHSKAATVFIGEQTQRFCQQCSRFHVLAEFDDGKRSCRKRLADHNRRRRKPQPAPVQAIEAAADAQDQSHDAPTGSTQSSKGSPMQTPLVDEQQTTVSASVPAVSSTVNEGSSNNGQVQQVAGGDLEPKKSGEQIKAGASSSSPSGSLTAVAKSNCTSELAGASQLAASLSLGATDLSDGRPGPAAAAASREVGNHFENAASASKHAVVMPWMQESKKHQSVQGFPYSSSSTKSDHNVDNLGKGTKHMAYGEKGGAGDHNSQSRSWMLKGNMAAGGVLQMEKDHGALMMSPISSRRAGKLSNETGRHEFLRLLGDERELVSSHTQSAVGAMQVNPSSTVGTLAFLDHSPHGTPGTGFLRDADQQRMIQFSSLQQQPADEDHQQLQEHTHQLHLASSNFIFGNHNHML